MRYMVIHSGPASWGIGVVLMKLSESVTFKPHVRIRWSGILESILILLLVTTARGSKMAVYNHWTGLVDWTGRLTLKFIFMLFTHLWSYVETL